MEPPVFESAARERPLTVRSDRPESRRTRWPEECGMEGSASAHDVPRSESAVKLVNSFKDLVTSVLGVLSMPLTVAVIVIASLVAFNDYERWGHRRAGPQNRHD